MKLYGLKVSYFTGKMEAYLRYKEIPHDFCVMSAHDFIRRIPAATGAQQMPAIQLDDGRWMTDTTPMIDWLETQYTDQPILPADPLQAFICRLIEDFADEWLWRPAMHYRWSYTESAHLLRRMIVDGMGKDIKAPGFLKRWQTHRRQFRNFVVGDGVSDSTREHVERGYLHVLALLQAVFDKRPFLLGERPTLADIGLMGPMLRHFGQDPTPAVIMREQAPAVMEWLYRTWNARASRTNGPLVDGLPADLMPLLEEIAQTHLENLCANAKAWAAQEKSFNVSLQGTSYENVPTSRYRVWCLEQLQAQFREADIASGHVLRDVMEKTEALEPLLRIEQPNSNYDPEHKVPFSRSIPVYENVV